jgi:cysteine desulfurase/selenocysteine lyase
MPPYQAGGDMISLVTFEKTHYNVLPYKFEAGTPNISGFAGLGAAVDYLQNIGMANIAARERELLAYATQALEQVPGLRIIGTARNKAAVLSFLIEGAHAHDLATLLDQEGIAVRSGHHCAHPLMQFYGVPATARASLAFWNTTGEIDALVAAIGRVRKLLG